MKKKDIAKGLLVNFKLRPSLAFSKEAYYNTSYSSYDGYIVNRPSSPEGLKLREPAKDNRVWQVLSGGPSEPIVELSLVENPAYIVCLSKVASITLSDYQEKDGKCTLRQIKSKQIKSKISIIEKQISSFRKQISDKEAEIEQLLFKANSLEKYSSSEEAVAAMVAEVLATGGDQKALLDLFKKIGVDKTEL